MEEGLYLNSAIQLDFATIDDSSILHDTYRVRKTWWQGRYDGCASDDLERRGGQDSEEDHEQ